MNFLAAMLLLVLAKDEEAAFWVLVALLDDGADHSPVVTPHKRTPFFLARLAGAGAC